MVDKFREYLFVTVYCCDSGSVNIMLLSKVGIQNDFKWTIFNSILYLTETNVLRGTAILNCITSSDNSDLEWIQYSVGSTVPQYIYTQFGFDSAYKSGGRHTIVQNAALGSRDLVITQLKFDDSGLYVCSDSSGSSYRTELTVIGTHYTYFWF